MPEQNVLIDMNLKLTFERQLRARLNTFHEKQVKAMVHSVNANDDVPDFAGDEPELTNILYTHFESIGVVFANRINQMVLTEIEKDLTPVDAKMFNEDVEIKAKRKLPKVPVVVDRYFRVRASNVAGKITKTTQKEARRVLAAVRKLHDKGAKVGVVPVNLASTSGRMFRTTLNGRASGIVRMNTNGPAEAVKLTQVQLLRGEEPSLSGAGTTSKGTKRWSNMADSLVRGPTTGSQFNHQRANQTVKINEPFIVSGEQLRFPGDESLGASLGNVINCRCAVSYNIKEVAKKVKKHAKNLRSSPSVAIEDLTGQAVVRGTGPFAIADDVPLNSIMNVQGKIDPEYLMELERSWAALPPEVRQLCKETNLKIRVGETLESLLGQNLDTQLGAYAVDKGEIYLGNYVTHNGTRSAILDRASDTLRHEIGHHIDYTLRDYLGLRGSKAKKFKEAWQAARVANAGDDGLNYYFTHSSLDRNMEESFAEAFRSAFNPSKPGKIGFSKNAQGFYFDKNMKDVVEVVRAQIDDYIQMRTRGSLIKSPLTTKPKLLFAPTAQVDHFGGLEKNLIDNVKLIALKGKQKVKKAFGAIKDFIFDDYNKLNKALRAGTATLAEIDKVNLVSEAIELGGGLKKDVSLYRGVTISNPESQFLANLSKGDVFEERGFSAWTTLTDGSSGKTIAEKATSAVEYARGNTGVVFKVTAKEGTKGIVVNKAGTNVLLDRRLKFKVVDDFNMKFTDKTGKPVIKRMVTVEITKADATVGTISKVAKPAPGFVSPKKVVSKVVKETPKPKVVGSIKTVLPKASESPDFAMKTLNKRLTAKKMEALDDYETYLRNKAGLKESELLNAIDGLEEYIGDSENINSVLRTGHLFEDRGLSVAQVKKQIKAIDKAISLGVTAEDTVVYRGLSGHAARIVNPKVGMEFVDDAIGSWSGERVTAANFMRRTEYGISKIDPDAVMFRMKLKKGSNSLFLDADEAEFLLPRGTKYRIVEIEDNVPVMRKTSFKKGQSPSVNRRVATVEIIPEGEVASPVTKLAKKKVVKKKAAVKKKVAKRKRPLNDATSPKVKATLPKASESPDFDVINIESQFSPNDSIIARLKPFDEVLPAKQRAATIDAIDNYVTDSDFINSYLRTGKEITLDPGDIVPTVAEIKNSVKLIDTAISGAKVQEDITVYRGITSSSVARINPKIGMEFSDKGFGSWSGHRELAAEFMGKTTDTKTAIIRMRLNKGDKALFLNTDESEFLLPRNMRYKILDIEENVAVDVIDDIIKRRVITVEPIF